MTVRQSTIFRRTRMMAATTTDKRHIVPKTRPDYIKGVKRQKGKINEERMGKGSGKKKKKKT